MIVPIPVPIMWRHPRRAWGRASGELGITIRRVLLEVLRIRQTTLTDSSSGGGRRVERVGTTSLPGVCTEPRCKWADDHGRRRPVSGGPPSADTAEIHARPVQAASATKATAAAAAANVVDAVVVAGGGTAVRAT